MKRKLFFLLISVIVIITIIICWRIIISPQYSLKQLKKVISRNDQSAFDKYIDLDRTVDNAIDQIWQYYIVSDSENDSRWVVMRNEIGYGLLSMVKPNLNQIIKEEVYKYVASNDSKGNESGEDNNLTAIIIKAIKGKVDPEDWEFQSINHSKAGQNSSSLVLTYYDKTNKANFLVEIKMRNMNGYWQIIEITNVAQLLNIFSHI